MGGYDRYMVPPSVVGAGYCAQYKELPRNLGLAGCFAAAARDMQCVNKHHISYGKGSRSGRCLCDTSLWCTSMEGLGLGNSGAICCLRCGSLARHQFCDGSCDVLRTLPTLVQQGVKSLGSFTSITLPFIS